MDLRPGERIDRYTLVRPLGKGGQGSVWHVIDPLDGGASRALKLVRLDQAGPTAFTRARREAKILAHLTHPGLVACHALFEDLEKGLVGVLLDLVHGPPLDVAARDTRMSRAHRFAVLYQIAQALAHVHAAGLVHRDLKPSNVLVTEDFWTKPDAPGAVKLVDFGIAAAIGNPQRLTREGGVIGTVPYLAPELFNPAHSASAEESFGRDLFAFGVIAWELLRGVHPAGDDAAGSFPELARRYSQIAAGRWPWPPGGLSGSWGEAIGACLALHPGDRPENGAALLEHLRSGKAPSRRQSGPDWRSTRTSPHASAPSLTAITPTASMDTEVPRIAPPPRRQAKPSTSTFRGATFALAGAIALLAGAIYLKPPDGASKEFPTAPSPVLPLSPVTAAPVMTTEAPVDPRKVCCGGAQCDARVKDIKNSYCESKKDKCKECTSGRAYVPGSCAEMIDKRRPFLLRLAHVDMQGSGLTVCVRSLKDATSEPRCLPKEQASDEPDADGFTAMRERLPIRMADLLDPPGLAIVIKDFSGNLAVSSFLPRPNGLKTSALCTGAIFEVGNARTQVAFYLDDP